VILLYEHPLSPYSQKVKIALAEKGIPFTTRLPAAFGSGAVQDEEFKRDNPRHEVPTLVDGDLQVFDSTVILNISKINGRRRRCCRAIPPSGRACACLRT